MNADLQEHSPYLPPDFWQSRPSLLHIWQAALARSACPDAVLHSVLARIAAAGAHYQLLPGTILSRVAPNYFCGVCGPPGVGKSGSSDIADELLPDLEVPVRSIGSGQSIAAAYFDETSELGDDGKRKKTYVQVRHNAFIYVDEGSMMATIAKGSDSILYATLRAAWNGAACGTSGVEAKTTRQLAKGSYRLGVVANFQPYNAASLFADVNGGLPQRFVWVLATYPRQGARPAWPGPLTWAPTSGMTGDFTFPPEVVAHIIAEHEAIQAGERQINEFDSHANLLCLKMAALLAQLDKRSAVSNEDWRLAGMMADTSKAARTEILRQAREAKYADEAEVNETLAYRAEHIELSSQVRKVEVGEIVAELKREAEQGDVRISGKTGIINKANPRKRGRVKVALMELCNSGYEQYPDEDGATWLRKQA